MSRPRRTEHIELLEKLGVEDLALQKLARYLGLLEVWSQRVNLTGARSAKERVETLVTPVLEAIPHVLQGKLVDVGSGNGSPGLVVAALRVDVSVVLLEPRLKRWAFLREVCREWKPRPVVLRLRDDEYTGGDAATVTIRALSRSPDQLRHLLGPQGRLVVMGRQPQTGGLWRQVVASPGLSVFECST